ncbi:probable serine/threonine-protein kinase clkA [Monomorium pharaonis]|uniref:probable serine/threonine-protein kinase clkA n=1 Tax=Monomorium pharaonis TaxID=307658 RepID=UPI00102E13D0|nr:probable serine/threonine-protein kinase clkA [Monomorium pharaonis]
MKTVNTDFFYFNKIALFLNTGPDILANFAKNVASVLSPAILGDIHSRNNRSSFLSTLTVSDKLNNLNSRSVLNNIVDKTSNAATYYKSRSYPYNELYENSSEGLESSEENERLDESLRENSYLRQEQPNFYRSYGFSENNGNIDATARPNDNIEPVASSQVGSIQDSATNLYSTYHGFPKAAFPHGPFLDKPYGGFHGFGPYGHHHGHHHGHHSYGGGSSEEASPEESARIENNGTNRPYGPPYFGEPYPSFPYGGYGNDFYGPYHRNRTDSPENGHNRHYGYGPYGPYNDGHDFYGPPGYGYGYGNRNGNGNGNGNNGNDNNNNNQRQTEEPGNGNGNGNGDQNNATKNGYSPPYGPPWVKPLLGTLHPHGFPYPLPLHPYDHGVFKGGPVVGVGPVGYPIFADPFLVGFPLHPYGPFFPGKKYLPKNKPADSGESTEAPAELTENETPERITATEEVVAPASSSNRFKTTGRKDLKRINLVNLQTRRV